MNPAVAAMPQKYARKFLAERIDQLDVAKARADVQRFFVDPSALEVWSREFFRAVSEKIPIRPPALEARKGGFQ